MLDKNFSPSVFESKLYKETEKYFKADVSNSKNPFTVMMPPPNVTGSLHSSPIISPRNHWLEAVNAGLFSAAVAILHRTLFLKDFHQLVVGLLSSMAREETCAVPEQFDSGDFHFQLVANH